MSDAPRTIHLAYMAIGRRVHVLGSSNGSFRQMRPLGTFEPDWSTIETAIDRTRALVHHAADSGEMVAASVIELRGLGAFLFDELVPLPAKRWLRDATGSLSLSLPPELLGIPWELMHTGSAHLAARWSMGRVAQLSAEPDSPRVVGEGPLDVLIVADPDGRLHESYDEGMVLARRLDVGRTARVSLRAGDVDESYLRREARSCDILHYAGHIDATGWRMSESSFDSASVRRISGGAAMPALVFANGCGGAQAAADDAMLDAWLSAGVRHHLAPLFDVPDRLARLFALEFYRHLFAGEPIGDAVRAARVALADRLGEGATAWGSYVLYGEPETRYAQPLRASATPPQRAVDVVAPTRLHATEGSPVAELVRRPDRPVARLRTALNGVSAAPPARKLSVWDAHEPTVVFCVVVALALLLGGLAVTAITWDRTLDRAFVAVGADLENAEAPARSD